MFGIVNFSTFLMTCILLNLTPGADTMYILGRGMSQGKKAGVVSALGISTGALVHTVAAALGLSLILQESATAFEIVKYAGAVYLIYIGIQALRTKQPDEALNEQQHQPASYARLYVSGILTNVLNPKVALFFLAFLPQFIDPAYAHSMLSFLLLGLTFVTTATLWCLVLAVFSARLADRIRSNARIKIWIDRMTGGLFVYLGVRLALMKK